VDEEGGPNVFNEKKRAGEGEEAGMPEKIELCPRKLAT
jgi:hypothetical protein